VPYEGALKGEIHWDSSRTSEGRLQVYFWDFQRFFSGSKLIFSFILISILFRDFVMGTAVALVVVSSSAKVASSFEDHLKTTVLGKYYLVQTLFY
jgi:hypothetical protein